jgi:hypothetical protein
MEATMDRATKTSVLVVALYLSACGGEEEDVWVTESSSLTVGVKTVDPVACDLHQYDTICNGMHCCPNGKAMSGLHIGENTLECRALTGATDVCFIQDLDNRFFQVEGQWVPSCPGGTYMKGYNANGNLATCCNFPTSNYPTSRFLDGHGEGPTQESRPFLHRNFFGGCYAGTLHSCPGPAVMQGLNAGQNKFHCVQ